MAEPTNINKTQTHRQNLSAVDRALGESTGMFKSSNIHLTMVQTMTAVEMAMRAQDAQKLSAWKADLERQINALDDNIKIVEGLIRAVEGR